MDKSLFKNAALELLASATLNETEVDALVQRALDQEYWHHLNSELSIGEKFDVDSLETSSPDATYIQNRLNDLKKEGYFHWPPMLRSSLIERMRSGVERVRAERWPAVFSLVYDEFWSIFRAPSIVELGSRFLGSDYEQSEVQWTWYVSPQEGAHGWYPHSDNPNDFGALTVWIPLTDATVHNGCMYLIPKNRVPAQLPKRYGEWDLKGPVLRELLQAVRAVPAAAGSVIGWDQEVVHWGSIARSSSTPRISVGSVLVRRGAKDRLPSFTSNSLPSFNERLKVIGTRLLDYHDFEPSLARYENLARKLVSLPDAGL